MPTNEHLVLCGQVEGARKGGEATLRLSLHGSSQNVRLEIADISKRLVANIPAVLVDLLEIASYIYAADSTTSRGGAADAQMGARWRRQFRFLIPVRLPDLWSSHSVTSALVETLSFLSDDVYEFEFQSLTNPPTVADYFEFSDAEKARFTPDEVILFSGGLDSFAGALEALSARGKRVALVSHRSAPKIVDTQKYLVAQLRGRFGADRILHVPIWTTLKGLRDRELTHRTRSFLFAALGTVVARLFNKNGVSFYENGVMSLNLPPVAQVVGARATRSTHPQAMLHFRHVLAAVLGHRFDVDNPFGWMTKAEVIERVAVNGCGDLIRHTRSCTRVRDMTTLYPHCGQCSQCIDRRFAIIAANLDHTDPAESYKVDLFLDERKPGPDREMALAFVRSAAAVNQMTDSAFFAHYGETSRIVGCFPEPADTVAGRIFDLYRRHAATICRVFGDAIRYYSNQLLEGSLHPHSLLFLIVSQREGVSSYPDQGSTLDEAIAATPEIRIAIEAKQRRVRFDRWGILSGTSAALLIALSDSFRNASRDERAPENYPFIKSADLARLAACESDEILRRRIYRCRNAIVRLAKKAGDPPPSLEAVIENVPWRGYRLNPDRIRLVAPSELPGGG